MLPYIFVLQYYINDSTYNYEWLKNLVRDEKCPHCSFRMIFWGSYYRTIQEDGSVFIIRIIRKRCKDCGGTCSFPPPFVWRYRIWSLDSFIKIVRDITQGKAIKTVWENIPTFEISLKSLYCAVKKLTIMANEVADTVYGWISLLDRHFELHNVPGRETVKCKSSLKSLGILTATFVGFTDYRRVLKRKDIWELTS